MLSLLASIYGKIIGLRNLLYDRGVFETFDLGMRTISVGNITAGGTGKTPLVAYIADTLAERSEKVCILTRGYGRKNERQRVLVSDGKQILADPREAGDEPFELAQKLRGKAIVIADADRVGAAEWAKRRFGVTAFVLDDGFQHRKVKRDVEIVCIDANDPFGGDKMLPVGRLREPLENLTRADVIVIMRPESDMQYHVLRSDIRQLASNAAVFEAKRSIKALVPLEHLFEPQQLPTQQPFTHRSFAFCGLGNPQIFYTTLKHADIDLPGMRAFGDHHIYSQRDITEVEKEATVAGAECLLTTVKDAVKLKDLKFQLPCHVVEIDLKFDNPEGFASML